MTDATIRPLTAAHLDAWHALQQQALADPFTRDSLAAELRNPLSRQHGLFRGRRLIGAFLAWLVVDELQIMQVAVAQAERRRGHGRMLVDHAVGRARAAGAVTATLEVRSSNGPARRLYESMGFHSDGRRRRYYPDGEDAVLMRRDLRRPADDRSARATP